MPDTSAIWEDTLDRYPESWLERSGDNYRLKSTYRRRQPVHVRLNGEGALDNGGVPGWYIPGSFGFCLNCGVIHHTAGRDSLRLAALSGEGRSSATTMLTLASLRYLYEQDAQLSAEAKKVLGFRTTARTPRCRSDTSTTSCRSSCSGRRCSRPCRSAHNRNSMSAIAGAVFAALGFDRDDPGVRGNARRLVQDTLRNILGYRIYYDLRRGWRFNNPNLEQLGLLRIAYRDLEELPNDSEMWREAPPSCMPPRRRCAGAFSRWCSSRCAWALPGFPPPRPCRTRSPQDRQLRQPARALGVHRG